MTKRPNDLQFVSRAGLKLAGALDHFQVDPAGWVCGDLGANVGGFTDCLLQRGAQKVYSVDTGYGVLDYKLRKDPRVVVMERVNAMHVTLPEPMDLIVIDLGWTPQKLILPRARDMIKPSGQIITLIKPHYEAPKELLHAGVLDPQDAEKIFQDVLQKIPDWNLTVKNQVQSPIQGTGGNYEFLVLLEKP
jgi:23S rRNA (cytidine1920-2'-O)/16S rRNA (cytidine1409-2'-O)-methyltransferase